MTMTHPGLPLEWSIFIVMSMLLLTGRALNLHSDYTMAGQAHGVPVPNNKQT